jgi:hypothetical protein
MDIRQSGTSTQACPGCRRRRCTQSSGPSDDHLPCHCGQSWRGRSSRDEGVQSLESAWNGRRTHELGTALERGRRGLGHALQRAGDPEVGSERTDLNHAVGKLRGTPGLWRGRRTPESKL